MTVNRVQWRALIGIFNSRISGTSTNNGYNLIRKFVFTLEILLLFYHYFKEMYTIVITLLYILVLLLCHIDIEPNPGPKKLKKKYLSVCHWNFDSYLLITSQNLQFKSLYFNV